MRLTPLVTVLVVLFLMGVANALTNVSSCQNLTVLGENYRLIQNVSINGSSCFYSQAANITLDYNGFTSSGNNTSGTYGLVSNSFNTTLKNGLIRNFGGGVYFQDNSKNSSVSNFTINISKSGGVGVYTFDGPTATFDSIVVDVPNGKAFSSSSNWFDFRVGTFTIRNSLILGNTGLDWDGDPSDAQTITLINSTIKTTSTAVNKIDRSLTIINSSINSTSGAGLSLDYITLSISGSSIVSNLTSISYSNPSSAYTISISSSSLTSLTSEGIRFIQSLASHSITNSNISAASWGVHILEVADDSGYDFPITLSGLRLNSSVRFDGELVEDCFPAPPCTYSRNGGSNFTLANSSLVSLSIGEYSHNHFIYNNTFSGNLSIAANGSGASRVYLNNFNSTTGFYVNDSNRSNSFNGSINGKNQGNMYRDVQTNSVEIRGNNSSSISGQFIGTGGAGYPYNQTTSNGKIIGATDYAPLTPYSNTLPVISGTPTINSTRTTTPTLYINDTWRAYARADDSNSSNGTFNWQYLKNGVVITNGTTGVLPFNQLVNVANLSGNDVKSGNWTFRVQANDSLNVSAWVNSSVLVRPSCFELTITGQTYVLNENAIGVGTCFSASEMHNIVLDAAGYNITATGGGFVYGLYVVGFDAANVTVKNSRISGSTYGIRFAGVGTEVAGSGVAGNIINITSTVLIEESKVNINNSNLTTLVQNGHFNSIIENSILPAMTLAYCSEFYCNNNIYSNNNVFRNNSILDTVTLWDDTASNNTFYWNNFSSSGAYVDDTEGTNYYNTTVNGKNQGNIWGNVQSGAVPIFGNVSSSISGQYLGAYGLGYPYNQSTSLGKFTCEYPNCGDFAPLTSYIPNPTLTSPFITPTTATVSTVLTCNPGNFSQIISTENNASRIWAWYQNGTSLNVSSQTLTPISNNVLKGSNVTCSETTSATGTPSFTVTNTSSLIFINNSIPTTNSITTLTTSSTVLSLNCSANDLDGGTDISFSNLTSSAGNVTRLQNGTAAQVYWSSWNVTGLFSSQTINVSCIFTDFGNQTVNRTGQFTTSDGDNYGTETQLGVASANAPVAWTQTYSTTGSIHECRYNPQKPDYTSSSTPSVVDLNSSAITSSSNSTTIAWNCTGPSSPYTLTFYSRLVNVSSTSIGSSTLGNNAVLYRVTPNQTLGVNLLLEVIFSQATQNRKLFKCSLNNFTTCDAADSSQWVQQSTTETPVDSNIIASKQVTISFPEVAFLTVNDGLSGGAPGGGGGGTIIIQQNVTQAANSGQTYAPGEVTNKIPIWSDVETVFAAKKCLNRICTKNPKGYTSSWPNYWIFSIFYILYLLFAFAYATGHEGFTPLHELDLIAFIFWAVFLVTWWPI